MNMTPFSFGPGDLVGVHDTDRRCIVTRIYPGSLVGLKDCGSRGESEKVHIRLIVPAPPAKEPTADAATEIAAGVPHPDLSRIEEEDWEHARLRFTIIKPLLALHPRPVSAVEQRARDFGYARSRLYAWMRAFRNGGETVAALLDGKPATKGTRRLDPRIDALLDSIIETHYLTNQKRRISEIDRILTLRCRAEKIPLDSNPDDPGFCKPHVNTIRNRINALSPRRRDESREGRDKASKYGVRGEGFVAGLPAAIRPDGPYQGQRHPPRRGERLHLGAALDHGRNRRVQPNDRWLLHRL